MNGFLLVVMCERFFSEFVGFGHSNSVLNVFSVEHLVYKVWEESDEDDEQEENNGNGPNDFFQ